MFLNSVVRGPCSDLSVAIYLPCALMQAYSTIASTYASPGLHHRIQYTFSTRSTYRN